VHTVTAVFASTVNSHQVNKSKGQCTTLTALQPC
jgi:hypothetical protein